RAGARDDVVRLLAAAALADVPVVLAWARTGDGVADVRAHRREVMRTESVGARTARDESGAVARRVASGLAEREPDLPDAGRTAESLAEAAGVPAVAHALEAAVARPSPVAPRTAPRPAP